MNRCFNCGYMWADLDEDGTPITGEYCHYDGPDSWAPCEQDDAYDYSEERAEIEAEEEEYAAWLDEQDRIAREEEHQTYEYGAPYDYQEF